MTACPKNGARKSCENRSVRIDRLGALARSLTAGVWAGATPLPRLTHKWTTASVRTAGACAIYLLAFGAHRDRFLLHMLRPFCLTNFNGHGKCEQSHNEGIASASISGGQ